MVKLVLNCVIVEFCNLYEEVDVEFVIINCVINIIEEGYDFVICIVYFEDFFFIVKCFIDLKWIVCVSFIYFKNKSCLNYFDDLIEYNCLIYKYDSIGLDFWLFYIEGEFYNV